MRETDTHIYFWGSFLSNFYWAPNKVTIADQAYEVKTSEHGFMLMKAWYFGDGDAFDAVLRAPDGKSAKAVGRAVKNFDPNKWNEVCDDFMFEAVLPKFAQNDLLAKRLQETYPKIIVEASPFDRIWGVGLHFSDDAILDEKNWVGDNRLGKVHMRVRDRLAEPMALTMHA